MSGRGLIRQYIPTFRRDILSPALEDSDSFVETLSSTNEFTRRHNPELHQQIRNRVPEGSNCLHRIKTDEYQLRTLTKSTFLPELSQFSFM